MSWVLLTFISVLSRAIYGVLTKVLSNQVKTSVYTQAAVLPLAGALISLALAPFLGGLHFNFQDVSLVALLLIGFGQGFGNITYFVAMKSLTNGTAQIAFSSILIFNTTLALVFMDLRLSALNVFGLILLMLAVLSVVNGKVKLQLKGISLMVLSAFCFAVFQLASVELSQQVGALTYLMTAYVSATIAVFILKWRPIIKDLRKAPAKSTVIVPFVAAVPSVGNFLFAYYAYRAAPSPTKVAMLLTSQVVFTVILSYFLLNERKHLWRKVFAAALVVVATIMIKN